MKQKKNIELRGITPSDRIELSKLLCDLELKYPGGLAWFDNKFDHLLLGKGRGVVAEYNSKILGVAITTPKGSKREKLSTLKIANKYRGLGIGTYLLNYMKRNWVQRGLDKVWVTVDARDVETVGYFSKKASFSNLSISKNRYGEGRDEVVLGWKIENEQKNYYGSSTLLEA